MTKSLHTPEHKLLRSMLRDLRVGAGKTQSQLAAALSKPQSYVAKYEGGERRLDVLELIQIVRALGTEPVDFILYFEANTHRVQ